MSQLQTYSDLCWTVSASSTQTENGATLPNPALADQVHKQYFEKNITV